MRLTLIHHHGNTTAAFNVVAQLRKIEPLAMTDSKLTLDLHNLKY